MRFRRVLPVVLSVGLLGAVGVGHAQDPDFVDGFDDPGLPGWEVGAGARQDDGILLVPAGGFAIHPDGLHDLEVGFQVWRYGQSQAMVHYRWTDTASYAVRLAEDHISIERHEAGGAAPVAETDIGVAEGRFHNVLITAIDDRHTVAVDGVEVLSGEHPADGVPGAFGFRAEGGDWSEFENLFVVSSGPVVAPATTTPAEPSSLTWVRTGGPLGGLGYDVRMVPEDPDTMFVTDAWAGIFVSEDGGRTWSPTNNGIDVRIGPSGDAIPVFCLTIDPTDSDVLWAGTQEVRGIFRSTDGGRTWEKKVTGITEQEGITFRGLTVDPTDPDVVYAAAEIASWAWSGEPLGGREFDLVKGVVYKTTNGGESWTAVWRGDNLARYVILDPRDTEVVYLSTGIFDREAANSDPGPGTPGGVGVVKSTDGGATWSQMNSGLGNLYVGSLFMHPDDPDVLLAGTGHNQYFSDGGAYLTTDGAANWTYVLNEGIEGGSVVGNINSVEFAASDPRVAYAASAAAVFRSEDSGRNWNRMSAPGVGWGAGGVRAGFPIDIQVDPRDADRLFINNYGGGNFVSSDGGQTWDTASTGYTGAQARGVAVDPANPGRAYVASRSGLFVTGDGGARWLGREFPPEAMLEFQAVAAAPDGERVLASTTWAQGVALSSDAGTTWRYVPVPLGHNQAFSRLAFAPGDSDIAYAGVGAYFSAGGFDPALPAGGVYRSNDGGASWRDVNDAVSQDAHVNDLAVHPDDADRVFAATRTGLLSTDDGGTSWTAVAGLPSTGVRSVAIDPHEPANVLAGLWGAAIHRSQDGGNTWRQTSAGLGPESDITDLAFDLTRPGTVYAADRFSGVYRSEDGGSTWHPIRNGLRTRAVNSLALSGDGLHLYAATEGEGLYRLDLNGAAPPAVLLEDAVTPDATTAPDTTVASDAPLAADTTAPATTSAPSDGTPEPEAAASGDDGDGGGGILVALSMVAGLGIAIVAWVLLARRRGAQ